MHIKRITIEGYRSYKEQTVMEDFDSRTNVVVGRNGAGKSNFFAAIRFLLMEHGQTTRPADRKHDLHDGAGRSALSAYVEIVFDNTDGRLPSDKEEVSLRRTIGMKKDEYFIDRHHMNKSEVASFLESAGFSRSNPYYIVQQGKVNELAMKKDHELLALLKDVAGTKVYEERRKESLEIMQTTHGDRDKILKVIEHMDERLDELEGEKAELMEYHKLDKEKRSLEYTIYEKNLMQVRANLDAIEADRRDDSENTEALHTTLNEMKEEFANCEHEHAKLTSEVDALVAEKKRADNDRKEALKSRAKVEVEAKEVEERLRMAQKHEQASSNDVQALRKEIAAKEKKLEKDVIPAHEDAAKKEKDARDELAACNRRLAELHAKQGRKQQFSSKQERDQWIKAEIAQLEQHIKEKEKAIKEGEKSMRQGSEQIAKEKKEVADMETAMEEREGILTKCADEKKELNARRNELNEKKKSLWKEKDEVDKKIAQCEREKSKAESTLKSSTSASISKGLMAVEKLVAQYNIGGVYGPLIELFKADAKFDRAIEVTAGNSLFHVVVEDDNIAERLMKLLQERNEGRVTFMPLNRLRQLQGKLPELPEKISKDAFAIVTRLEFDEYLEPAMNQVFGKTLVCRSLDFATKLSREYDRNCVTLDGDQVNKKGALTGGFIDQHKSRLSAVRVARTMRDELEGLNAGQEKTQTVLEDLEQEISQVSADIHKLDHKVSSQRDAKKAMVSDIKHVKSSIARYEKTAKDRQAGLSDARSAVEASREQVASLREEIGTELLSQLSPQDRKEADELSSTISKLEKQEVDLVAERCKIEEQKEILESELNNNLKRRLEEITMEGANVSVEEQSDKKSELDNELAALNETINELNESRSTIDSQLKTMRARIVEIEQDMEQCRNKEAQINKAMLEETKRLDRLVSKRSLEVGKREDLLKKIRELGSLPQGAFEQYKNIDVKKLMKMLHSTNEKLKKYDHVNKKAMDQFVTFTEQRQELTARKEEMDKGEQSIKELIEHLDHKKEEAIERTFKQVSQNFEEIFAELVHGGHGKLTMKTGPTKRKRTQFEEDGDNDDEDDAMDEGTSGGVLSYQGVSVEVTFPGGTTAVNIDALSGGQKTMVALCLIFAIQRCDPAPFYLFDEIDANLDDAHRAAVANMIQKASQDAQYIVSTFRPEMIEKGNKFYEVSYQNRVSKISPIEKKKSLQFVQNPSEG